jgi:hypothetical protein
MKRIPKLAALIIGVTLMTQMTEIAVAAPSDAATDPRIDPQIRPFLADLNKDQPLLGAAPAEAAGNSHRTTSANAR